MAAPAAPAPRPASRPAPTPTPTATRPAPSAAAPPNSNRPPGVPAATTQRPAAAPSAAPARKPSRIGAVTSGVLQEPKRFFLYGTPGVGKTTLAADIPGAVFLDLDRGSGGMAIQRWSFADDESYRPTYNDVLEAIADLTENPSPFKALVIDEASALEALIWRHVVDNAPPDKEGRKPQNIEEVGGGFAKGYIVAEQEWRRLVAALDTLRLRRGMHWVVLSHAAITSVKNPTGDNYDSHAPKLHAKAAAVLAGAADVYGFATFDDIAKRQRGGKVIGITGHRVIHLEHAATWAAKTRLPLPPMIDMPLSHPWGPFQAALDELADSSPDHLRKQIDAELARLGEHFTTEAGDAATADDVRRYVASTTAAADLRRFLTYLRASSPAPTTTDDSEATP